MKVLHLGTDDYAGGAARAMYRWHISLRKMGVDSEILCLNKSSNDPSVSVALADWEKKSTFEYGILQRFFIESNRTKFSDTFFSHPLGYASIADHELIQRAEVIHVHWTSLFFHWQELRRIRALGKSIVLTPHDLWTITGGCHYPGTCDGYLKSCLDCPMLREDPFQLVSKSRALKQKVLSECVDIVISPSHWMDRTFRELEVVQKVEKIVIPYCIDVERFTEKPKERTKKEIGFDSGRRLVLFCANNVTEGRKGLDKFVGVLKICEDRPEFRKILEDDVEFVLIGKGSDLVHIPTIFRIHGRGYAETTADLGRYYSAADLMIYLGLEDNLPNVILEAMACGVPVLAFETGGVGDLVVNDETGELVRSGDLASFAARMVVLLADPKKLSWLGMNGREKVLREFSEQTVSARLLRLYASLAGQSRKALQKGPDDPETAVFESAVQAAIRAATIEAYRSFEQQPASIRPQISKQAEEIRILRGYLEQLSLDREKQSNKQEREIGTLRDYLAKQEEQIRQLHGRLEQVSIDRENQSAKQEEEIRKLEGYLEGLSQQVHELSARLNHERQSVRELSAALDRERQKTFFDRLGEKLIGFGKIPEK